MQELILCETVFDAADSAAEFICEAQTRAVEERGVYRIALSGGSTPQLLYEQLGSDEWRREMSWEQWEIYWVDERAVPPDHAESNYRLAHELWLKDVPIVDIFRMRGEAEDLTEAASEYARLLRARFSFGSPVFDTVLLGMGADGHTASLFPGHPALRSAAVVETVEVDQPIRKRLTLTLPVINLAQQVIVLVTGEEKADAVAKVIDKKDSKLPATLIQPLDGECLWVVDQPAGSKLKK